MKVYIIKSDDVNLCTDIKLYPIFGISEKKLILGYIVVNRSWSLQQYGRSQNTESSLLLFWFSGHPAV